MNGPTLGARWPNWATHAPRVMTTAGMQFCYVPAGPLRMGSKKGNGPGEDPLAYEDEEPQHELDLPDAYWLGRYPVTNAQFAEFVAAGGYANAAYWPEAAAHGYWRDGRFQDENQPRHLGEPFTLPNHPVVGVSWYEALAYARWLTEQLPAGWQARLPSEAEWEKAARRLADSSRAKPLRVGANGDQCTKTW
ncbi:MAG: SUMF1/EgtB/PvdO family nonheme iron enzyme [Caldilineaceae bacterium]